LRLTVLWVGKTRDRRLADLIDEYVDRIRRYCRIEIIEIRDVAEAGTLKPADRTRKEGERILKSLRPGEFRVALDEKGREMTSERFAAYLGRALEETPSGVKLILGGPYGLSEAVLEAAENRCSLSKMTLTHEMARLVALDQVYRAFTILRGERYHH